MSVSVWYVFWVALLTDFATGLGALPLGFVHRVSDARQGFLTAVAGGMMLSASLFFLAHQALVRGRPWEVVAGLLVGAGFLHWAGKLLDGRDFYVANLSRADSRRVALVVLAMFFHSFPEGVAVGVGYATGELEFGLLMAISIAVHNIPEGTAVALPLRAAGVSIPACVGWAVLTSVPQPIAAVPAFLLVSWFQPLLPAALGFAAGAMIFLVFIELMPDCIEKAGASVTAWGVMAGLCAMLWLGQMLSG